MPTFKLTLSYDGTHYAGWQRQPGQPTIQGALESALAAVAGEAVAVAGCSRTDAGVHALGQTASFALQTQIAPGQWVRALNTHLPADVAVLDCEIVLDGFHASGDALRKRYRYAIHDGTVRDVFQSRFAWHYPVRLDAPAMHAAAQALVGEHDFKSFENHGTPRPSTVRTIYDLTVRRAEDAFGQPNLVHVEVEGNGFLYNMVRNLVGTLVDVGRGARPLHWPAEALAACDRSAAGMTAPPQGLVLLHVTYPQP